MKPQLLILLIFLFQHWMLASEPIALISKLRGVVKHKMVSDIKYKSKTIFPDLGDYFIYDEFTIKLIPLVFK